MDLTGSYVAEILQDIYESFDLLIESGLPQFIKNNQKLMMTIEGRIGSYWGEYNRRIRKSQYCGFKIQKYYIQTRKQILRDQNTEI